jgi:hypothetical protein
MTISFWKGEDNGNNEVVGKPPAVWNFLDAYATGKVGRCFRIREVPWGEGGGSDLTSLTIANDADYNFDPNGTFSIGFWFNNTTTVDEWGEGGNGEIFYGYGTGRFGVRYYGSSLFIDVSGGEGGGTQAYAAAYTPGTWIKIRLVYSNSYPGEGKWDLYTSADGTTWALLVPDVQMSAPLPWSSGTTFKIGTTGSGEFHTMEFCIDEIKIPDSEELPSVMTVDQATIMVGITPRQSVILGSVADSILGTSSLGIVDFLVSGQKEDLMA